MLHARKALFPLRVLFAGALLSLGGLRLPAQTPLVPKSPPLLTPAFTPAIQVTLSQPVYRIHVNARTGEPQMPNGVTATATVQNWPIGQPLPTTFTWRVYLDWDFKPFPTHHSIAEKTFLHASPFRPDFGQEIRGGTLTVIAATTLNGQQVFGKAKGYILGDNPPPATVLAAFPRSRFGLIASKIGVVESGLRQFTSANGLDAGGMLVLSRTNDVGMMQLNAPTGSVTSADQVWDWRANVQQGLDVLAGKQRYTVLTSRHFARRESRLHPRDVTPLACLNCMRYVLGLPPIALRAVPTLSIQANSGLLPGETDPDALHLTQIEREAIRRYNGGREYGLTIMPNLRTLNVDSVGWQVDPLRGGIRPTSGDPNYVFRVLQAHSGLTLPPPPKPVKKKVKPSRSVHSARRRHHRR